MRDSSATLDLVEELRLRRWARLHHVAAEERQSDWHPVILEEMLRKDAELAEQEPIDAGSRLVPIANGRRGIHAAHPQSMPRFLSVAGTRGELHYT